MQPDVDLNLKKKYKIENEEHILFGSYENK